MRTSGISTRTLLLGATIAAASLVTANPGDLDGQVYFGGHMAYAVDVFGGTAGLGGRVGFDLPMLPIDLVASGEYFFPECEVDDCGLWGGSVEALLRLPIPLVRPYGLAGMSYRNSSNVKTSNDTVESSLAGGFSAGGGVDLNLLALRVFLDARYEFLAAPVDQWVVRLGLNF